MQTEYLVEQQINLTFIYFLMSFVVDWVQFHKFFNVWR